MGVAPGVGWGRVRRGGRRGWRMQKGGGRAGRTRRGVGEKAELAFFIKCKITKMQINSPVSEFIDNERSQIMCS